MRRWLHALGWVWKRAQLVARDDDPQRVEKLAASAHAGNLGKRAVVLFADELDIHLLPRSAISGCPKARRSSCDARAKSETLLGRGAGAAHRTADPLHEPAQDQRPVPALLDRLDGLYQRRSSLKSGWSWTITAFTKPRRSSSGWRRIPVRVALPADLLPQANPIERALGMSMTSVPVIISAPASRIWSGMWSSIRDHGPALKPRTCTTPQQ